MNKIIVYGIANCDTIKKTLDWYKKNNIAVEFHDYKKLGIAQTKMEDWCKQVGWQALLNKKSTTWRALPVEVKDKTIDEASAISTMRANTSLIKRPVIEINNNTILVGPQSFESLK